MARRSLRPAAWCWLGAAWGLLALGTDWFLADTLGATLTCRPERDECVGPGLGLLLGGTWLVPAVIGAGLLLVVAGLRVRTVGPAASRWLRRTAGPAAVACVLVTIGGLVVALASTLASDPSPVVLVLPVTLLSSVMLMAPWLALALLLLRLRRRLEVAAGPG
jgi:hypothetical protein